MRKSILLSMLSASVLGICMTPLSYAGMKDNSAGLTFGVGSEFFAKRRNLNNATLGIAAANYQFTQNWGAEFLFGWFNTKYKPSENYDKQVDGRLYLFDITYHFMPDNRWSPYIFAGPGVSNINSNQYDATTQSNVNGGVGIQYFADEVISLRLDARDIYTFVGSKNDVLVMAGVNIAINWC